MLLFSIRTNTRLRSSGTYSPILFGFSLKISFFSPSEVCRYYIIIYLQRRRCRFIVCFQNCRRLGKLLSLSESWRALCLHLELRPFSRACLKVSVVFCNFRLEFSEPFESSDKSLLEKISGKISSTILLDYCLFPCLLLRVCTRCFLCSLADPGRHAGNALCWLPGAPRRSAAGGLRQSQVLRAHNPAVFVLLGQRCSGR